MSKFINTRLLFLIIIAVLIVFGLVWVMNSNRAIAPENGSSSQVDTEDWQTYRNEELGFEFRYPGEWGEIIQTTSSQLGNKKLLININSFQRTELQLNSLATLQAEREQCDFNLITSRELKNNNFASISIQQTKNRLSWEKCLDIFNDIPEERKERKVVSPHAYTIVYLNENEIPEIMKEDYRDFKLFIESFKTI